jgi:hypothetical protein
MIDGVLYVSTAELNAALPFVMKAQDIEAWGFTPKKIRAGSWWRVDDVLPITWHVTRMIDQFRLEVARLL